MVWKPRPSGCHLPQKIEGLGEEGCKACPPPCQGTQPLKPPTLGRAYVISKKEAAISGTVVTGTLFLNSKPFCVLFDSGATHSFISTHAALQLTLKTHEERVNYRISLPNGQVIACPILYRRVPIVIADHELPGDFIQFNMSEFNIILGMDWLTAETLRSLCEVRKDVKYASMEKDLGRSIL